MGGGGAGVVGAGFRSLIADIGSCLGARSFGVVGVLGRSTSLALVGTTIRGRLVFRGLVATCGRDLNGFTTAFLLSTAALTAEPCPTRVGLGTSCVLAAES